MRGRLLVKFGYFLLIFVNVVPVAITKHGTHRGGHQHGYQTDPYESNSVHHNEQTPTQNHQDGGDQLDSDNDKLQCKCDDNVPCACDRRISDPREIGNFSCSCKDNHNKFLDIYPINCFCPKNKLNQNHLKCYCVQKNGDSIEKYIECPLALGYFIETNDREIDFRNTSNPVHFHDETNNEGLMQIREKVDVLHEFGTTIPSVPKAPNDIDKPTTFNPQMTSHYTVTTPNNTIPEPPDVSSTTHHPNVTENPNPFPTEPSTTSTTESPTQPTIPPPPPTIPTSTEAEMPSIPTLPPLLIPDNPTTPSPGPSINESSLTPPAVHIPGAPSVPCPNPEVVDWANVRTSYKYWFKIIDIRMTTEYKIIYKKYFEYFKSKREVIYECKGTYKNGHVVCKSGRKSTVGCTKDNLCNCICIGHKADQNCFCSHHILEAGVDYKETLDIKGCKCYNNGKNSLICDCNKMHKTQYMASSLNITTVHITQISIFVRYLAQHTSSALNVCSCNHFNGESTCECLKDTDYLLKENPTECLCFYEYKNNNLEGYCYCDSDISKKEAQIIYDEKATVVTKCKTCHYDDSKQSQKNLKCSDCQDYNNQISYGYIDVTQWEQIDFEIILRYYLRTYEYRNEHFTLCRCSISSGITYCNCNDDVLLKCTKQDRCNCLSVYKYEQGNFIRTMLCNPHILIAQYKFIENTTQLDACSCHHTAQYKLNCICTGMFPTDSHNKIFNYNEIILDLSRYQQMGNIKLLEKFSQIREFHNETLNLATCHLNGDFEFVCIFNNLNIKCTNENPCMCLCVIFKNGETIASGCVCNPYITEPKIDYNPNNFELEVFTCIPPESMNMLNKCKRHMKQPLTMQIMPRISFMDEYILTHSKHIVVPGNHSTTVVVNGQNSQSGEIGIVHNVKKESSQTTITNVNNGGMEVHMVPGQKTIITQGENSGVIQGGYHGQIVQGGSITGSSSQTTVTHGQTIIHQGESTGGSSQMIIREGEGHGGTIQEHTQHLQFHSMEEVHEYMRTHHVTFTPEQLAEMQKGFSISGGSHQTIIRQEGGHVGTMQGQTQQVQFHSMEEVHEYMRTHHVTFTPEQLAEMQKRFSTSGGSSQMIIRQEGGHGSTMQGQTQQVQFHSMEEVHEYMRTHHVTFTPEQLAEMQKSFSISGGSHQTIIRQEGGHGGNIQGYYWKSGPIQTGETKFNSVEEMQKYMQTHQGGQETIIQGGNLTPEQFAEMQKGFSSTGGGYQTIITQEGGHDKMKFNSMEEMQKYMQTHQGGQQTIIQGGNLTPEQFAEMQKG